ncbi:MAG: penicillin-insensitive murein endopeptidase, partial [Hyphomicrobiaceae bacterium]|nr:penicillin-insensitive murein endopeptidase [Hyphomicrobiaceae bacterium]
MRIPTLAFGLTALLALPALVAVVRDPALGARAAQTTRSKAAARPKPTPAKELFGAVKTPAPLAARSIGFYAKGCLAGAAALPIDGPAWQAMRLSRNRNWGHPDLIALIEKFAADAREKDGWPGLLVGDISQPRGGPMLTGHASHQVGLDADVWFTPMPDHRLSEKEREEASATSMLADDLVSVNPQVWSEAHVRLLKRAASYPQVERVLVHPAIKKAVCEATKADKGADRAWLSKVRPYWGHYYHFHIRIACPKGNTGCQHQPSVGGDDGCGAELARWLKRVKPAAVSATPGKPAPPAPERRPITLDQMPAECRAVLATGTPTAAPPSPAPSAPGTPTSGTPAAPASPAPSAPG